MRISLGRPAISVLLGGLLLVTVTACGDDPADPQASTSASATPTGDATASADPSATADPTDPAATDAPATDPTDAPVDPADPGAPAEEEEPPQVEMPTVDPPANPASVPDGAEVVGSGAAVDCSGKDVVITEGDSQITLAGTCRSVTVNASLVDLVGEGTQTLVVAGDLSNVRFDAVSGTVKVTGSANTVTAPDAAERIDEGENNSLY